MKYRVHVLADSVSPCGVRATTFAVQAPRVILAELNTHRTLSRNAASNRAIPFSKTIEAVRQEPYVPGDLPGLSLRGNASGMVAFDLLDDDKKRAGQGTYRLAAGHAVNLTEKLSSLDWHKQDANRLLEPFQWTRIVVTATDWANFFALRTDSRAYPPFGFLARCMYVAYQRSTPQPIDYDGWHLPFITIEDHDLAHSRFGFTDADEDNPGGLRDWLYALARWSAARCARVSYYHFGSKNFEVSHDKDDETYAKLITEVPRHASPLEHPMVCSRDMAASRRSNARFPWVQLRKMIAHENILHFEPSKDIIDSWEVPDEVFEPDMRKW